MVTTETEIISQSIKKESSLKKVVRENILNNAYYFNHGRIKKLSKCIGLIGPRGSGKSLAAAAMAIIDYLVQNRTVISNMSVKWGMKIGQYLVGYQSMALDKAEFLNFDIQKDSAVVVDEVNIEFSEARRSTTNRNLIFNKIMQQLRKRKLDMIYTTQHEMWIDNRLRWQTDIFIKCRDLCLMPGGLNLPYEFGEISTWNIYDMSGILGDGAYQDTMRPYAENIQFLGKQWWNTFNTDLIQGEDEMNYGQLAGGSFQFETDKQIIIDRSNTDRLRQVFEDLHNQGVTSIASYKLWELLGVTSKAEKDYAGRMIKQYFKNTILYSHGYYHIPDTDLDNPDTIKPKVIVR